MLLRVICLSQVTCLSAAVVCKAVSKKDEIECEY